MKFEFSSEKELVDFLHKRDSEARKMYHKTFRGPKNLGEWLTNFYWRGNTITVNDVNYDFLACLKSFEEPLRSYMLEQYGYEDEIENKDEVLAWLHGKREKVQTIE